MARDDRFSKNEEIIRELEIYDGTQEKAGPIVYQDGGRLYMDTSSSHIKVVGGTGFGKSYTIINYLRTILSSKESCLVIDPKGELFENTVNHVGNHKVYCLDMRNPSTSPDRINLLAYSYWLLHSEDVAERDMGRSQIRNLAECVYPLNPNAEPFWDIAARRLLSGIMYGLSEKDIGIEKFNLKSVGRALSEAEEQNGIKTNLQIFYDSLDADSLGKSELSTYCRCAARETRGSIFGVCNNGFQETFSVSEGLMSMLCSNPTIHLQNFDLEHEFIFYIILPDEDRIYSKITGLIIHNFYQMLIMRAQNEYGGCLPKRTCLILEELGSVGVALPGLSNMVTAARSRGIRITACLQSDKQLASLYSASEAKTIDSCLGVTIAFSNNDYEMLDQWSKSVGEKLRTIVDDNHVYTRAERIISPNQLRAMGVGRALILIEKCNLKFISTIPDYHEIFEVIKEKYQRKIETKVPNIPVYSVAKAAQEIRDKEFEALLGAVKDTDIPKEPLLHSDSQNLIKKIDERIKELEEEEEAERKRNKSESRKKNYQKPENDKSDDLPELPFTAMTEKEALEWLLNSDDEDDDES